MPIDNIDYHLQIAERKNTTDNAPQLLVNCLESIDASLWLIAGRRTPQALILLLNAIEIAFKADLERIHRVLIADSRKLDYPVLKSLLRDAFLKHPRGQNMKIPDFDLERTISFGDAMERVRELYPIVDTWKTRLKDLQALRNDVVHYGSSNKQDAEYAEKIATVAFPFLKVFLLDSSNVSLERIVTSTIFRELDVAREVCERMKKENQEGGSYVLRTVGHVMLYTYVDWPEPTDRDGWIQEDSDKDFEMAKQMRNEVAKEWDDCYVETSCRVCGSINLFVKVEPLTPAIRSVKVLAAKCPKCGLDIRDKHSFLAEYHVGILPNEKIESFLDDIGE